MTKTQNKRTMSLELLIVIIIISSFLIITFLNPTLTGFTILKEPQIETETEIITINQTYQEKTILDLNINETQSLKITGTNKGNTTIWANTTNGILLVYNSSKEKTNSSKSNNPLLITGLVTSSTNIEKANNEESTNNEKETNNVEETNSEEQSNNENDQTEFDNNVDDNNVNDNNVNDDIVNDDIVNDDIVNDDIVISDDNVEVSDNEISNNDEGNTEDVVSDNVDNDVDVVDEIIQEKINQTINKEIKKNTTKVLNDTGLNENKLNDKDFNGTKLNNTESNFIDKDFNDTKLNESIINETQNLTINQSINQTVNQSTNQSTNQTVNQTFNETIDDINKSINYVNNESNIIGNVSEESTINISQQFFENECEETCNLNNVTIHNLIIEVIEGEIRIDNIQIQKIKKPIFNQIKQLGNITLQENESIIFDIQEYFSGKNLIFDTTNNEGYKSYIEENKIIFTAVKEGNWSARIYAVAGSELYVSNEFIINVVSSSINITQENISQQNFNDVSPVNVIKVGETVKWRKVVPIINESTKEIMIPDKIISINISESSNNIQQDITLEVLNNNDFARDIIIDNQEKEILRIEKLKNRIPQNKLEQIDKIQENLNNKKNNLVKEKLEIVLSNKDVETEISSYLNKNSEMNDLKILFHEIDDLVNELIIEYETEAPIMIVEEETENKKIVTITSETHYENVIANTKLPIPAKENSIKVNWLNKNELIEDITYIDENNDGFIESIEWTIPHLSNQTFEISIVVLNPIEYLKDGDDWIVYFNTTGIGDLRIYSTNAFFEEIDTDDENTIDEMRFTNLLCGENSLIENLLIEDANNNLWNYTNLTNTSIKPIAFTIKDYSCNDTSTFTSYMNIAGYAILNFTYANQYFTVSDIAIDPPTVTLNSSLGSNTKDENLTVWIASSNSNTNITDWRLNGTSLTVLNMPFDLNESSMDNLILRDYSTYENNGTLAAGSGSAYLPTWTENGKIGGAYYFDGGDRIRMPYHDSLAPENFTFSMWMNVGNPGSLRAILRSAGGSGYDHGLSFLYDQYNQVRLSWGDGVTNNGERLITTINYNTWFHIVGSFDGTTMKLYYNGELKDSNSTVNFGYHATSKSNYGMQIGYVAGYNSLLGTIDELLIFDRALSDEQIAQLYQDGLAGHSMETLVSNETAVGDNYTVMVTPNNATGDGTSVLSNSILITNETVMGINSVILNSSTGNNLSDDNLTVYINSIGSITDITDWRLNGTSLALLNMPMDSNANDYSTHENNGTVYGATHITSGCKIGGCYDLDGNNDYIQLDNITGNHSFTLSFWVNFDSLNAGGEWLINQRGPVDSDYDWQLFRYPPNSNKILFGLKNSTGITHSVDMTSGNPPTGQWIHLVAVFDYENMKVKTYNNGTLIDEIDFVGQPAQLSSHIVIGKAGWTNSLYLNGKIDEVLIFGRALSNKQITQIYNDGLASHSLTTMVAEETLSSDTWSVMVTPNNATNDGTAVLSNNVVIDASTCGTLNSAGTTYTLNSNVASSGTCFTISAQNITLDCAGHSIIGTNNTDAYGVYSNQLNTTIKNCVISNYSTGIFFSGVYYGNISDVTINATGSISGNNGHGLYLYYSDYNALNNIYAYANLGHGIRIHSSNYNTITNISGESIENRGFYIGSSEYNQITNGTFKSVDSTAFMLYHESTTNNNFTNINISSNDISIYSQGSSNNTFTNFNVHSVSNYAIFLTQNVAHGSNYNKFINGITESDERSSIYVWKSNNNSFTDSTFISSTASSYKVVSMGESNSTYFFNNTIISTPGSHRLLDIGSNSYNNVICLNNFTYTTNYYVDDSTTNNFYNCTYQGKNQGNIYYNVMTSSLLIQGQNNSSIEGLYISTGGLNYPYNNSNSGDKVSSNVVDYAPLTPHGPNNLPVMTSTRISPIAPDSQDTLIGYCTAFDFEDNNVSYYYRWYVNGILNLTGSTSNYSQSVEVNVANITSDWTNFNDNWTLSCLANNVNGNSSWINDSVQITFLHDLEISRLQYATGVGTPTATATWGSTPIQGNLLIAITGMRMNGPNEEASITAPDGWTKIFSNYWYTTSDDRRGLAMFYKIANASESGSVSATWSPGSSATSLLIQEFSINNNVVPILYSYDFNNSGASTTTSQTTGTTDLISSSDSFVITALLTRGDSTISAWTNNVTDTIKYYGTNSVAIHSGYISDNSLGIKESTATLGPSSYTSAGIAAFIIEPSINSVILESTYGGTYSFENLSVTTNSKSIMTDINDWRINGTSLAVLNMPFNTREFSISTDAIQDYSTYENNGTLGEGVNASAPTWTSNCKVGGCYEFDGVDDKISIGSGDIACGGNGFTMSAWIKANSFSSSNRIITKQSGTAENDHIFMLALDHTTPTKLRYRLKTGTDTTTLAGNANMVADTWYHVVGNYNGSHMIIYLNGDEDASISKTGNVHCGSNYPIEIGSGYNAGSYFFNGSIDEVMIFNKSLSEEQIKEIYQAGIDNHSLDKILSQETTESDNWTVMVTPNNGLQGNSVLSNNIFILGYEFFNSTWDTTQSGISTSSQIALPLESLGTYDFYVSGDTLINSPVHITSYDNNILNFSSSGIHNISIYGFLDGWRFNDGGDKLKLLEISNWGHLRLGNRGSYFYGASNLEITATDTLILEDITSLHQAFRGCSAITTIPNINNWDFSNIQTMNGMFRSATNYNQNISNWNTNSLINTRYMFFEASNFNGIISGWDMSKVTDMSFMFASATNFNQDLSSWDTNKVTKMGSMFHSATIFNNNITTWNTIKVDDMSEMFRSATNFNQNIGGWNTDDVTNMQSMFQSATNFNQDLSSWDTSKVTSMSYMFSGASSFNRNIGSWNVSSLNTATNMFSGVTLSTTNYNNLLIGWASQSPALQNSVTFSGGNSKYDVNGLSARNDTLIGTHSWSITDSGRIDGDSAFNSTWKTDNTGPSGNSQITLPLASTGTYDFWVYGDTLINSPIHITSYTDNLLNFSNPGTHNISIYGTINGFRFNTGGDRLKLLEISNWGPLRLGNSGSYFYGASNLEITATDVLNTSGMTSMYRAFRNCGALTTVPNMGNWDMSSVDTMFEMFRGATNFNEDISGWDTRSVNNMRHMFYDASSFNQPIGSWNTSIVTTMEYMFYDAYVFNQNLSAWDTSKVNNMLGLFTYASAFDNDVSGWDTSSATTMKWMFYDASSFNQPLNWNTSNVIDMHGMFSYASNFNQPLNNWNTSKVSNMSWMFVSASSFNGDISIWDTRNVVDMSWMFYDASSFNQDIGGWNTSKVNTMLGVFTLATLFNQNLNDWDVSNVIEMSWMFSDTSNFNQNLTGWNTSNVIYMGSMFSEATAFNGNITNWDTHNVTDFWSMFSGATNFNQNIGDWNTSNAQYFNWMFDSATSFNQDIGSWNTNNVINMDYMFNNSISFNQDLSDWNTTKVTNMSHMFSGASSFNQNIGSWNVSILNDATNMFSGVTLSTPNYDSLLIGWASQSPALQNSVSFSGGNSKYSLSALSARNDTLIGTHSWSITDGGTGNLGPAFNSTWKTDNSGSSGNSQIDLPLEISGTYDFYVYGDTLINSPVHITSHTNNRLNFNSAGTHNISIYGDIEGWKFGNSGDRLKLLEISSWGPLRLGNNGAYFYGASNLEITASDVLNTSGMTSFQEMFRGCSALTTIPNINNWDTSSVINMMSMFFDASSFNQDLSGWDTSNITNMAYIFTRASSFNGNISSWNISNLLYMDGMFDRASNFNQDISSWNTSGVTDMSWLFYDASNFNQDISSWNTSGVTSMDGMFYGATSFDQNLSAWNISSLEFAYFMFEDITLSTPNYDSLLIGWASQSPNLLNDTVFSGGNSKYSFSALSARNDTLIGTHSWSITDGGIEDLGPAFNSTWKTDNTGPSNNSQIDLPLQSSGTYDFYVVGDTLINSPVHITSHTNNRLNFNSAGTHNISIYGTIEGWSFNYGGDKLKLLEISSWGSLRLGNSGSYFYGASNLEITATDVLNTSGMTSMYRAFRNCGALTSIPNITLWNMSEVTTMERMFEQATNFNQDLDGWDTSNVINMVSMFYRAESFNGSIGLWDTGSVEIIWSMFESAESFNQDIGLWNTSSIVDFSFMFYNAYDFNQNLTDWNTSSAQDFFGIFEYATSFNGDVSGWDTSNVTNMRWAFMGAQNFNQDIGGWNTSNVLNFEGMFNDASSFNQNLSAWDTSKVTDMGWMFLDATNFNQNLSAWNTSKVTNMGSMFGGTSFDQDIGSWNISSLESAQWMFDGVTLSTSNYDNLLIGWASQSPALQNSVSFHGGNSKYSLSALSARNDTLIGTHSWSITDGGFKNEAPVMTSSVIVPSDAITTNNLIGSCTATDADGDDVSYYYRWYLDGVLNGSGIVGEFAEGVSINVDNISSSLTSKNDAWILSCMANDGFLNSSWLNSTEVTILNSLPSTVELIHPEHEDSIFTNLSPEFNWTAASDNDGDDVTYQFQIDVNNNFISPIKDVISISNNEYLWTDNDLDFVTYHWRVRAHDGEDYGEWSDVSNFTVVTFLKITLVNSSVEFGLVSPREIFTTETNSPTPFVFLNEGNIEADLTNTSASLSLWESATLNTRYWQIKARSGEGYDELNSITSWINVSNSIPNLIMGLNKTSTVLVDVLIESPFYEGPGEKSSNITFEWIEAS